MPNLAYKGNVNRTEVSQKIGIIHYEIHTE